LFFSALATIVSRSPRSRRCRRSGVVARCSARLPAFSLSAAADSRTVLPTVIALTNSIGDPAARPVGWWPVSSSKSRTPSV